MKFLERDIVALNVEVSTPEEAIQKAGHLLSDKGYVTQSYIDAMIRSFQKNGPYFVIAPNIAIPHARPEDGVKEASVSLIQLKEPVSFGSTGNDPVKLVFALGASNSDEHLNVLKMLMKVLGNAENTEKLKLAKNYEEIKSLLN
ncbi:PTS sugar transporter subunit IIA [Anoxybacteroides rupiense]|uniref:PTS sugar transporter subunit IIA n=1 Tax=Anoxybacteroides rupiense TaxID=311460 RepID=UPI00160623B8|nr:PTS sugar transporter subunit IIA [Anoxybacillus rupiensis]MBB3908780.1 PTS system mannitol-specific IIA component/PTS system ascorbate-specific IIA component [Anoxybacillus rupiensis]